MIFAVVDHHSSVPCISYLEKPVKVKDETVFAFVSNPVRSTEVFRFAAPCEKSGCNNWSGSTCRVAQGLVQILPTAASELPDCKLRPTCRWYEQEGGPACLRCPLVITDDAGFEAALNRDYFAGN